MRKILGLTLAAMLVLALAGIGTWAFFSDVETSTGNASATVKLNPKINDKDTIIQRS